MKAIWEQERDISEKQTTPGWKQESKVAKIDMLSQDLPIYLFIQLTLALKIC